MQGSSITVLKLNYFSFISLATFDMENKKKKKRFSNNGITILPYENTKKKKKIRFVAHFNALGQMYLM